MNDVRVLTLKNAFFATYGNVSAGTYILIPEDMVQWAIDNGLVCLV